MDKLKEMISEGEIASVEGLWITHYHYDHVEGVPEFQRQFDCPCFADRRVVEVLKEPSAWRLAAFVARVAARFRIGNGSLRQSKSLASDVAGGAVPFARRCRPRRGSNGGCTERLPCGSASWGHSW